MEFLTVKMLKDEQGSPDGIKVRTYYKDCKYDLPKPLAISFVEHIKCSIYITDNIESVSNTDSSKKVKKTATKTVKKTASSDSPSWLKTNSS